MGLLYCFRLVKKSPHTGVAYAWPIHYRKSGKPMNGPQQVFRVRRNYNRWVVNETLEDYALRFTAKKARKWTEWQVAVTTLGSVSFLALEAIGAAITLSYGFINSCFAILAVSFVIFLTALPITYHAARQGTDIDLLTRGAGFGYLGSTLTSLIYATYTFIFFALEAAILAFTLELTLNVPLAAGYLVGTLLIVPIVTHGITLISRFQIITQPFWLILQILALAAVVWHNDKILYLWWQYVPVSTEPTMDLSRFNLTAFGCASTVLFSLIAQVGEQVDFIRFLPQPSRDSKHWRLAMLSAGPGWIIIGAIKIMFGSCLAVLALNLGENLVDAVDPNRMYLIAYGYLGLNPELTMLLTGSFVILSQLKINVTNAYAGSIAWSNFFSRLTQSHPGRVVWLIFNLAIALVLMELGIFNAIKEILGIYSIIAIAWIGTLVADLVINRPLKLRPAPLEFKRAYLYDINPVGIGSLLIASLVGFTGLSGWFGETGSALASYLTLLTTLVVAPLLALLTKGKFYLARQPATPNSTKPTYCCICEHPLENEDMAFCPAYSGLICSLCCSLDSRCNDLCKTDSALGQQMLAAARKILPAAWYSHLNHRMAHFIGLFLFTGTAIAALLGLLYYQITTAQSITPQLISSLLINLLFFLLIVSGIAIWMYVLVHENRKLAQEESSKQTHLLLAEVSAHKKTYQALQEAKDLAEQSNKAKSRYLTGLSHELRSPLNAILGYAQLLEKDVSIPINRRDGLGVIRRSGEHLADLIEGLLDISRIEAGKLELSRDEVNLKNVLEQLAEMFRVQAAAKSIDFDYRQLSPLPSYVRTDEKRLRQILINLLSNAVKYTHQGGIVLTAHYRNQVAEFTVEDTGIGIAKDDLERIYIPFERIKKSGASYVHGTGLGLTITKFLTEIMGGNIEVTSTQDKGSIFKVKLLLASIKPNTPPVQEEKAIVGYLGPKQTVFVVDDEPSQRNLMYEMLSAIGFTVVQAPDGLTCLDMLNYCEQDANIFLLDISMPGIDGWDLAHRIKQRVPSAVIIMISANASEMMKNPAPLNTYCAYLVKPVKLTDVLYQIQRTTGLIWTYEPPAAIIADSNHSGESNDNQSPLPLAEANRDELIRLAKIGYANGLLAMFSRLERQEACDPELLQCLVEHTKKFQFRDLIRRLETL